MIMESEEFVLKPFTICKYPEILPCGIINPEDQRRHKK